MLQILIKGTPSGIRRRAPYFVIIISYICYALEIRRMYAAHDTRPRIFGELPSDSNGFGGRT